MAIRRIPHPSAPSYGTSYGYGSYYGGSSYPSYSYAGYGDPSYGYGYSYPSYGYGSYYSPGYRVARRVAIRSILQPCAGKRVLQRLSILCVIGINVAIPPM